MDNIIRSVDEIDESEILAVAQRINGRRRTRTIDKRDVSLFAQTLRERFDNAQIVRVYSSDGFVANSYKYRADIVYLQAVKVENGWRIEASTTDAKRSYGAGARITVDGRAA